MICLMQVCLSIDCDKHKIPLTKIVGLVVWSEWTLFCFRPNITIRRLYICHTKKIREKSKHFNDLIRNDHTFTSGVHS